MRSPILHYVIPSALVFLILSLIIARWTSGAWRRALRILQIVSGGYLLLLLLAYLIPTQGTDLYGKFRPKPQSETHALFQGIIYIQEVRTTPSPMVIHVVKIDLDAPGIRFVVTPPNPFGGRELRAQTTSTFLRSQHAQLAINGDFFDPWWDNSLVDYWPWAGMPVDALGFAASNGKIYSDVRANHSTVFITKDNRVTFDERIEPIYNAISGNILIVVNGQPANMSEHPYFTEQHPRTAIGLDQNGRVLIFIVIDGRQSGYSIGASDILIQYGAWTALNMDGGGSSALVMESENSLPAQLSVPIHNHIPYRERPIANHLGVYALSLNK